MATFGRHKGAPIGNKNASGHGRGHVIGQPHKGIGGFLGRAAGLKQFANSRDAAYWKKMTDPTQGHQDTTWMGRNMKIRHYTPHERARMTAIMKRTKPW